MYEGFVNVPPPLVHVLVVLLMYVSARVIGWGFRIAPFVLAICCSFIANCSIHMALTSASFSSLASGYITLIDPSI